MHVYKNQKCLNISSVLKMLLRENLGQEKRLELGLEFLIKFFQFMN